MHKAMTWPVVVMAETRTPAGHRVRMLRREEGAGDIIAAMLRALQKRKDHGAVFSGCEIHGITMLGQHAIRILDPDTLELVKLK